MNKLLYSIQNNFLKPAGSAAARHALLCGIRAAAAGTGRKPFAVYRDLLRTCHTLKADYEDYFAFCLYRKSPEEQSEYLTRGRYDEILPLINKQSKPSAVPSRTELYDRLKPFLSREWMRIDESTPLEAVKAWADRHPVFAARTDDLTQNGRSERISPGYFEDEFDIRQYLVKNRLNVAEEFIISHDTLLELCPSSVATVTLSTFDTGKQIRLYGAALRIASGDNSGGLFCANGIICPVDVETGVVSGGGRLLTDTGTFYEEHPSTGIKLAGFQVPLYPLLLEQSKELARQFPQAPFMSWEFAVGQHSPLLTGVSFYPDHIYHQYAYNRGMYPAFVALAKEYVRNCESK